MSMGISVIMVMAMIVTMRPLVFMRMGMHVFVIVAVYVRVRMSVGMGVWMGMQFIVEMVVIVGMTAAMAFVMAHGNSPSLHGLDRMGASGLMSCATT